MKSKKMCKIKKYLVLLTICVICIVFLGTIFFVNYKTLNYWQKNILKNINNNQDEIRITGTIRTSGLTEEERERLDLTLVRYQITDFLKNDAIQGYFLISNNVNIDENLLGKCVELTGYVPNKWKDKNPRDLYDRSVLNVLNLRKIDKLKCKQDIPNESSIQEKEGISKFRGKVFYGNRPAPDIAYDYHLKLSESSERNSISYGFNQEFGTIYLIPTNNNLENLLDNYVNKNEEITVEGYLAWGYAESQYLQVISISKN